MNPGIRHQAGGLPPAARTAGLRAILGLVVIASIFVLAGFQVQARAPLFDAERGVLTLAPILERTTPAVVNISVATRAPGAENPLLQDPFFRRFFGLPERIPEWQAVSAGSGVIVEAKNGYVVTNHHLVNKADRITVTIKDGRRLEATLVGSDAATDIALVKIEADKLTALTLGDSDTLKVGDVVVAVGNPFGLGQTVTSGIVSALGRSGLSPEKYEDFIQTDAPINPGNSGGALLNSKGELMGVNTAIIAPGGGNVGIGFAVPSNMVKAVMRQLLRHGEVRRGRIGISVQTLTPNIARELGLPDLKGAVIASVETGSPAEKAGLAAGDAVVAIDGKPIDDAGDLRNAIGLRERGETVEATYYRKGERRRAKIRIAAP